MGLHSSEFEFVSVSIHGVFIVSLVEFSESSWGSNQSKLVFTSNSSNWYHSSRSMPQSIRCSGTFRAYGIIPLHHRIGRNESVCWRHWQPPLQYARTTSRHPIVAQRVPRTIPRSVHRYLAASHIHTIKHTFVIRIERIRLG